MIIQISSGNGPAECELAVGKFLEVLKKEFPDMEFMNEVRTACAGCFKSVTVSTDSEVSQLQGTIKWIAQSPFRPKHKRKNWFIDVSLFEVKPKIGFSKETVRFKTFRCGGHGGQNVNKVETGVRAIHVPTGLSVTATEARTQLQNKNIAFNRLREIIAQQNLDDTHLLKQAMWLQHELLERGNPVRTYAGMEFERIKT